ncbi:MAG: hypothetical protein JXA90_04255 [Planctomycetes bacterium]|nr:hypothetical protein [Planctomycetota bacterium]
MHGLKTGSPPRAGALAPGGHRARSRALLAAEGLALLLAFSAAARAGPGAAALPGAAAGGRGPEDVERLSLSSGLREVHAQRRPALIWYAGAGAAPGEPFFEEYLKSASFRRIVKLFVLIRLESSDLPRDYPAEDLEPAPPREAAAARGGAPEAAAEAGQGKKAEASPGSGRAAEKPAPPVPPEGEPGSGRASDPAAGAAEKPAPPPPEGAAPEGGAGAAPPAAGRAPRPMSVSQTLHLPEGPAALLVLDFRARVVRRYGGGEAPPRRSRLERELRAIRAESALQAQRAARVEGLLAQATRDFERGEVRQAVRSVLPLESEKERAKLDPVLRERVEKHIQDYRGRAETVYRKGQALEKEGMQGLVGWRGGWRGRGAPEKLQEAIDTYDELIRDYPFPDVLRKANQRKGFVLKVLMDTTPGFTPPGRLR